MNGRLSATQVGPELLANVSRCSRIGCSSPRLRDEETRMDSKRPPELILCAVIVGYLACTVPILNWWPPLSYDEC